MIKEIPMITVKQVLICDCCGGEMHWNGVTLCSYPPQYIHECVCGNKQITRDHAYPNIDFKEVHDK